MDHIWAFFTVESPQFNDRAKLLERRITFAAELQRSKPEAFIQNVLSVPGYARGDDYVITVPARSPRQRKAMRPEIPVFRDQEYDLLAAPSGTHQLLVCSNHSW